MMNNITILKRPCILILALILSINFGFAQDNNSSDSFGLTGYCSTMKLSDSQRDSLANGVSEKDALWEIGKTIRVRFLDGSNLLKGKVRQYASIWEQHANINFEFVESGTSDIRVSFARRGIFQSQIGTYALDIPANQPTMYLGFSENDRESKFRRLVLHEFGHVLGLHHEQLHPASNIQWDKPVVYQWFLRNLGWSIDQVDFNLFTELPTNSIHFCDYDPASIMHYFVLPEFTFNNFSVEENTILSDGDKSFIAKMYPNDGRTDPICAAEYSLITTIQGQGRIILSPANANNLSCDTTCSNAFVEGQVIQLTAIPSTGHRFVRWSGTDCNDIASTNCSITMLNDKTITAVFEEEPFDVNLGLQVIGNGRVDVVVDNTIIHSCSNSCAYTADEPVNVELVAIPTTGHSFVGWEDGACDSEVNTTCSILFDTDLNLRAVFEPMSIPNSSLSVQIVGAGKVVVTDKTSVELCSESCVLEFSNNSKIEVWAEPAEGYEFVTWEGSSCDEVSVPHCDFTLIDSQEITVHFEAVTTSEPCISFTTTTTNTTCDMGNLSVRVGEGVAPFSIQVTGPISGEATVDNTSFRIEDFVVGTYSITLEDALGCMATEQFTIHSTCRESNTHTNIVSNKRVGLTNTQIANSSPMPSVVVTSDYTSISLHQNTTIPSLKNSANPVLFVDIDAVLATKKEIDSQANNAGNNRCGTPDYMEKLLKDPTKVKLQQEKKHRIHSNIASRNDCTEPVVLPVAIHFQGIPNANRACLEAIAQTQIQTLNEDFQGVNSEISIWNNSVAQFFPGINIGETCLEFCIASKNHPIDYGLRDSDLAITINQTTRDFDSNWSGYINIFVNDIGALGYSPIGGMGDGDGVVIDIHAFGKGMNCSTVQPTAPYHLGRTLTHEIGHYLLLDHIWGQGCGTDDGINDTPNSAEPYYDCPNLGVVSCGSSDLHMNYMDYTNDACLYMFTADQSITMENYVSQYLSNVVNNASHVCNIEEVPEQISNYELNIEIIGEGSVTINESNNNTSCLSSCTTTYEQGQSIQLIASPKIGFQFVEWIGGSCNDRIVSTCAITIDQDQSIVALFEEIPATTNTLNIEVLGSGIVEIIAENEVKICEGSCNYDYVTGSAIELIAKPGSGYVFRQWLQGTCSNSTASSCEMALENDQRVIAIFEQSLDTAACIDFTTTTTDATCTTAGKVSIKVNEGTAPFSIQVKGPISGEAVVENTSFRIEDFPVGTYEITLQDANECIATKQFFIKDNCGQNSSSDESSYKILPADKTFSALDFISTENTVPEVSNLHLCTSIPMDDNIQEGIYNGNAPIDRLWEVGETITVKFLRNSFLQNRIIQGAREWEKYANIKFEFVVGEPADIRIDFDPKFNNQSFIGAEALVVDAERWTMNFSLLADEPEERIWSVILHEFGHALGLLHEQVHPENSIAWDKEAVYDYNSHLTRDEVDQIFFDLPPKDEVYFCNYDPQSVMHYPIENLFTLNDFTVPSNNLISEEDKFFIGKLYPFIGPRNNLECGFCTDDCTGNNLKINIKGQGSVVSIPVEGSVNQCHSTCNNTYAEGTVITLHALPEQGYRLVGWEGGNCPTGADTFCEITLDSKMEITAVFESITLVPSTKELKVRVDGEGSIIVDAANTSNTCTRSCTFVYDGPLNFQLSAVPEEGHHFVKWVSNYCSETQADCQFEIDANETITAIFEEDPSCLDFTITPSNSDCNIGMISVLVTEGQAPYEMVVNGPISGEATTSNKSFRIEGLPAGDYTILLQDAMGCETIQNFSIANTCKEGQLTESASNSRSKTKNNLTLVEMEAAFKNLEVKPNYPNPFRTQTILPFELAKSGAVRLDIFTSDGQKVYQYHQFLDAGIHRIELDSDNLKDAGLYIYHLRIDNELKTGKMVRL